MTKATSVLVGIAASNLAAMGLIALNNSTMNADRQAGQAFGWVIFFLVPLLMGLIQAYFLKAHEPRILQYVGFAFINTAVGVALSALFLHEGYICLLIISPLIFGMVVGGALFGRYLFKQHSKTLQVSIVAVIAIGFIVDTLSAHDYHNEVVDTMIIHAPPDKVWRHVVAYDSILAPSEFWMFDIGLPMPMATTVDGMRKGAKRKCIFSNGAVFDEVMSTFVPCENLTFDVVQQPNDPEIIGHISIDRGQFLLKDNGDGTTTLTGTSWYGLNVYPVWYYDMWAESITRNVHLRAMNHIKYLSELPLK